MNCFIAMAFGEKETDQLYEKTIKPLIVRNGFVPRRLDKVEHNEEINKKLIEEMNACSFAIADLTFARPSVYFEAGYINATKQVIYTCRKDHLGKSAEEKGLSVHFDLKMKNIVPWSKSVGDSKFVKSLDKKIKLYFGPVVRKNEKKELVKQKEKLFSKKSYLEKMDLLRSKAEDFLAKNKFKRYIEDKFRPGLTGLKKESRGRCLLVFHFFHNFQKSNFDQIYHAFQRRPYLSSGPKTAKILFHVIFTLNKVNQKQILKTLVAYKPVSKRGYSFRFRLGENGKRVYQNVFLFFDDVKSEDVFKELNSEMESILRAKT